ncbi:MAG: tRNA pseudouridine(13) synthase TruD [Tepidisphaerales bacterium]
MDLPYATADVPGIGGKIKLRPEDFYVQELPAYEPSGDGEHVLMEVQKVGLSTFDAVARLAELLSVRPIDIGYAGMKDRHAVTRQLLSVRGTTPEAAMAVKTPQLSVLWAARHGNKLRLGHLRGNRFAIKIREVDPLAVTRVAPLLRRLEHTGVPNYFGEQRFGRRGNNDLLGAALVRQDNRELARLLLGDPQRGVDDGMQFKARTLYEQGDLEGAMKAWPRSHGLERRLLHRVIKTGKPSGAGIALDEHLRRLFVTALQSRIFNEILAERVRQGSYARLIPGDWAFKHDNGACFHVEDVEREQPRCAAWEISPTGPLVGFRVSLADGDAGAIENAALARHRLTPAMFKVPGYHRVKGTRRPLRFRPADVEYAGGVDEHGGHITVAFTLPPGAFATVLLRELMKNDASDRPDASESPDTSERPDSSDDTLVSGRLQPSDDPDEAGRSEAHASP